MNYLVATTKPWHLEAYARWVGRLSGNWSLVSDPAHLEPAVRSLQPRYVFFPHWSWLVPATVLEVTECVCFHMTDVPYGRGGSPLQNLIVQGTEKTQLTALRMAEEPDAGPVYRKVPLALDGRAVDIYINAAEETFKLIEWIINNEPVPEPQTGEATVFPRRTPEQSRLPLESAQSLQELYDYIRMLDAPTYPHAFLALGDWRIEFTHAEKDATGLVGRFRIFGKDNSDESD